MLDTSNNFFDLISLMKILKIGPFSDYIGSKMVKNGLKIFSTWILKGVAYMNKKKCIPDERWDQIDSFGIYFQ